MSNLRSQKRDLGYFSRDLARFMRVVIETTIAIEEEKENLFENHMFSTYVAFEYLDKFGQGYLTANDLKEALNRQGIEATNEEVYYLMFFLGKKSQFKVDFTLTRPDIMTYEEFLNMISPADDQIAAKKFSTVDGIFDGREKLLPKYVLEQLLNLIDNLLKVHRKLESGKLALIQKYGYVAKPAWKIFAGDMEEVDYDHLRGFMAKNNESLTREEYDVVCIVVDENDNGTISRGEFLEFLTPFDSFLVTNLGGKKYEMLLDKNRREERDLYLKNNYAADTKLRKEPQIRMNHGISDMLQGIYTKELNNPENPANKDIYLNDDLRYQFNLRKKRVHPDAIRGFNDYYNDYFKVKYMEEKENVIKLAREKAGNTIDIRYLDENGHGMINPSSNYLSRQRGTNGSRKGILDKFIRQARLENSYKNEDQKNGSDDYIMYNLNI